MSDINPANEARAVRVECTGSALVVHLVDGRASSVPLAWFPWLQGASAEDRGHLVLMGGGKGLHWPRLDEDISVAGLLAGHRPS